MKREKVDKADKLDVFLALSSSRNCSSRRKSKNSASKTRIILSFRLPRSLTTQYITNSTNLMSKTNFRITTSHSPIPKICLPSPILNHLPPPKCQVSSKPTMRRALISTKSRNQLARNLITARLLRVFIVKAAKNLKARSKMHFLSINQSATFSRQ